MDYESIEARSEGELCEKLKLITLRGSAIQPYLNSMVSIETIQPNLITPCQSYILKNELTKVEQLRWKIIDDYGWDILQLNGYLKVHYSDTDIDILPPVVEEFWGSDKKLYLICADGQHRTYLAYLMGLPLNIVYVRRPSQDYYAYPLPHGWSGVSMIESIPEGYRKKNHTTPRHKELFRDYNSVFSNIGDSRKYEKPEVPIDKDLLDELQCKTGMDKKRCAQALREAKGDMTAAIDIMRHMGCHGC